MPVQHPITAAGLGVTFLLGRIVYCEGYSTVSSELVLCE